MWNIKEFSWFRANPHSQRYFSGSSLHPKPFYQSSSVQCQLSTALDCLLTIALSFIYDSFFNIPLPFFMHISISIQILICEVQEWKLKYYQLWWAFLVMFSIWLYCETECQKIMLLCYIRFDKMSGFNWTPWSTPQHNLSSWQLERMATQCEVKHVLHSSKTYSAVWLCHWDCFQPRKSFLQPLRQTRTTDSIWLALCFGRAIKILSEQVKKKRQPWVGKGTDGKGRIQAVDHALSLKYRLWSQEGSQSSQRQKPLRGESLASWEHCWQTVLQPGAEME